MKTKARDIIPGWPKGRSTSTARLYESDSAMLRWFLRANRAEDFERLSEFDSTILYHDAQQQMLTAHLERWRKPLEMPHHQSFGTRNL